MSRTPRIGLLAGAALIVILAVSSARGALAVPDLGQSTPPTNTPSPPRSAPPTRTPTPTPPPLTSTPMRTATTKPANTPTLRATSTPLPIAPNPTATPPGIATLPPQQPPLGVPTFTKTPLPVVIVTPKPTSLPVGVEPPTPTPPNITAGDVSPDLYIYALEVTQGTQNLANDLPLVEDRWTVVRVYVQTFNPANAMINVKGQLAAWRGNQLLGVRFPENGPIVALPDGGDRLNLDDSLYFRVPYDWRHGSVKFKAFVYAGQPDAPFESEPTAGNNFAEVQLKFHPAEPLKIRLVPVHLHQDFVGTKPEVTYFYEQNEEEAEQIMFDLFRMHPISELIFDPTPEFVVFAAFEPDGGIIKEYGNAAYPESHATGYEWKLDKPGHISQPNARIKTLKVLAGQAKQDWIWYGMVPEGTSMTSFKADGTTPSFKGWATNGVAYGQFDPDTSMSPWDHVGGGIIAHEVGHRQGLLHNLCAGNEAIGGDVDDGYPYPFDNCSIAAVNEESYYGVDVYWSLWPYLTGPTIISPDPTVGEPNRAFPFMGYMGLGWDDPYNYCKLLNSYGVTCDPITPIKYDDGAEDRSVSARAVGATDRTPRQTLTTSIAVVEDGYLYVSAVGNADGTSQLLDVIRLADPAPAVIDEYEAKQAQIVRDLLSSGFELSLEDASGGVLAAYALADTDAPPHGGAGATALLTDLVPYPDGTAFIRIRAAGKVAAEHAVSANAPSVRMLAPAGGGPLTEPVDIRWDASDADGDALTFSVFYSSDDGATWDPIGVDITGSGIQLTSLRGLKGSGAARFRVMASDGVHTTVADSEDAFAMPDAPPVPYIMAPGDGGTFAEQTTVQLRGGAYDLEDGPLPATALRWQSSIDGDLGTGVEIDTRTLSVGKHTVTLTATDSDGSAKEFTTDLTITERDGDLLPGENEKRAGARRLGIGTGNDGGSTPWTVIGIGAAAAAALVAASALASKRLRRRSG